MTKVRAFGQRSSSLVKVPVNWQMSNLCASHNSRLSLRDDRAILSVSLVPRSAQQQQDLRFVSLHCSTLQSGDIQYWIVLHSMILGGKRIRSPVDLRLKDFTTKIDF